MIIYENCTVRLASVGLAQARPNYYYLHEIKDLINTSTSKLEYS